jgi:hypothetical protein
MEGPYPCTETATDQFVTRKSAGTYALSRSRDGTFVVSYVGRSDDDVNGRLKHWARQNIYKRFKFTYATSPKAAFEKECVSYHDFGGTDGTMDNKVHPDRPKGTDWQCPRCNVFG